MKIPVILRAIMYDTQTLSPGESLLSFFTEEFGSGSPSATEMTEQQLVDFLLDRQDVRSMLLEEMGLSGKTRFQQNVVTPFVIDRNKKPGDIDILFCDPSRPQKAVAVEVKRAKVRDDGTGSQKVNKLGSVSGGIDQASALAEMDFGQVYIAIIVVVDGRSAAVQTNNYLDRGMTQGASAEVIEVPNWQALRDDVGILYIQVVQPVDRSITKTGVIAIGIAKTAKIREQSSETTAQLVRFFDIQ